MNIIMDPSPPSHSRSLSASSAYSNHSLLPPSASSTPGLPPKSPSATSTRSSTRSNRSLAPPFPGMGLPSSPRPSEPLTPRTPMSPPMSPPMSARSFGTFIDSEPSTPAYSPRMGSTWDNSTLVLLSPVSSAASSPTEPGWQMMAPIQKAPKRMTRHKPQPSLGKEISLGAALSSWPVTPVAPEIREEESTPEKKAKDGEEEKENAADEKKAEGADQPKAQPQPLERLTTRMKSLLRRRSESSAKKRAEKKQKRYFELDRVETTHWTEL